jgi:Icc-related predicted phosphoesterase
MFCSAVEHGDTTAQRKLRQKSDSQFCLQSRDFAMKILCFSDLHRDRQAAELLVETSRSVHVVVGAGDFASCRKGLADTLDILAGIDKPAVLVPGNGESVEELTEAAADWPSAHILHGSGCEIDGVPFWGVGGGIPVTPFGDWSYDFDEDQATDLLSGCPQDGVLVVHSPPIDTVDHDSSGRIRGSRSIREAVESKSPRLVVCGHIHSDWGKQVVLGASRILNAGPAGVVVDLGG